MLARAALALVLALAAGLGAARADTLSTGLSSHVVGITSSFTGADIMVFGAIERDPENASDERHHVVVTIAGPRVTTVVRRKERTLGLWVNRDSVTFDRAPGYYAMMSTYKLDAVTSTFPLITHEIGADNLDLRPRGGQIGSMEELTAFKQALIRRQRAAGLYYNDPNGVRFLSDNLFRTRAPLPASVPEGAYTVRVFLFQGGELLDEARTLIIVEKTGLERSIYAFAHEQPFAYGIAAIFVAAVAGWAASVAFRR